MFNLSNLIFSVCCGLLATSGFVNSFGTSSITRRRCSTALNFVSPTVWNINRQTAGACNAVTKLSASKSEPVPGLGDEGCALPSPSKVNTLPLPAQAAVFFGYYLFLYGGTSAVVAGKC